MESTRANMQPSRASCMSRLQIARIKLATNQNTYISEEVCKVARKWTFGLTVRCLRQFFFHNTIDVKMFKFLKIARDGVSSSLRLYVTIVTNVLYTPKSKKVALVDWLLVFSIMSFITPGAFWEKTFAWRLCVGDGRRRSQYVYTSTPRWKI